MAKCVQVTQPHTGLKQYPDFLPDVLIKVNLAFTILYQEEGANDNRKDSSRAISSASRAGKLAIRRVVGLRSP